MKKTNKTQLTQNYAQALYNASLDDSSLENVVTDCEHISKALINISEFKILNNPQLKTSQKTQIVQEIAQKLNVCKTTENFLITVAENNRFQEINNILDKFFRIYHKSQNILEVSVQSVQTLTSGQQKKLITGLEKLLKQKIIINYSINPTILGGLIIEYGSTRIDDSLKGKLSRLEQVMKGSV